MSSLFSDAKNIFVGDENKIAKPIARFSPLEFNTPGLGVNMRDGGFTVNRTPQVGNALNRLNQLGAQTVNEYGQLKDQLKPGFGALTTAGVNAIEDQRRSTVSNLRDNLNRRRVLGSNFADDAVSRTNAEFAKQNAQFRAETTLQEIQATEQLITKQYETSIQGAKAIIDQGNFESQIGAELSRQFTGVMGDLAKYEASLLRDEADGQSALLSGLLGAGLTGGLGGLAGGLGGVWDSITGGVGGLLDKVGIGAAAGAATGTAAGAATGIAAGLPTAGALAGGALAGNAIATALPGFAPNIPLNPLATGIPGFAPNIEMTPLPATPAAPQATGALAGSGKITSFNTAPPSYSPGSGVAGPPQAQFDPNSTVPIEGGTEAAPSTLMQGPSGAAITGGGLAAVMALIRGDGFQQAIAQGGGAAAGAAAGFSVGGPVGGIVGGIAGSMLGGKLGEKLGMSFSGGGDDKPDYSLTYGANDTGLITRSPWGVFGFGHQKHLTNDSRYQAGLDFVSETDEHINNVLTPEESAAVKKVFNAKKKLTSNSNEGGFNPSRMMNHFFNDRKSVLRNVLGPERYAELGLEQIYAALNSGDPQKIATAFGGTA